jgi:hypothetical protein
MHFWLELDNDKFVGHPKDAIKRMRLRLRTAGMVQHEIPCISTTT